MTRRSNTCDGGGDVDRMANAVMGFVREFGLLQPDRTPCGKPLTVTQAHALSAIAARPGLTQRELAETLGLARATISELVADLCERGWIVRATSERDRRQRTLSLTAAGCRITDEVADARRALMSGLLAEIDPGDRRRVVEAVELLAATARTRRRIGARAAG